MVKEQTENKKKPFYKVYKNMLRHCRMSGFQLHYIDKNENLKWSYLPVLGIFSWIACELFLISYQILKWHNDGMNEDVQHDVHWFLFTLPYKVSIVFSLITILVVSLNRKKMKQYMLDSLFFPVEDVPFLTKYKLNILLSLSTTAINVGIISCLPLTWNQYFYWAICTTLPNNFDFVILGLSIPMIEMIKSILQELDEKTFFCLEDLHLIIEKWLNVRKIQKQFGSVS